MKKNRQEKIIELITKYEIDTQEELAQRLNESGFNVTQATVSRDIRQMKLTKIPKKGGGFMYSPILEAEHVLSEKYSRVLKEGFVSIETAQNILVIKTVAGMAMAVAAAVDAMKISRIVGSIAGDDTIMMVLKTNNDAENVYQEILSAIKDH